MITITIPFIPFFYYYPSSTNWTSTILVLISTNYPNIAVRTRLLLNVGNFIHLAYCFGFASFLGALPVNLEGQMSVNSVWISVHTLNILIPSACVA